MIRVETLKMEQNAGSENIRLSVSLRFHTMGLVPAYCGETRNRARPKTEPETNTRSRLRQHAVLILLG